MTLQGIDFKGIAYLVVLAVVGAGVYQVVRNGKQVKQAAADAIDLVNPASQGNIVNRVANKVLQTVTGNDTDTIGTTLARLLNPAVRKADAEIAAATGKTPARVLSIPERFIGDLPIDGPAPADDWRAQLEARSIGALEIGFQPLYTASASAGVDGEGGALFGRYPKP